MVPERMSLLDRGHTLDLEKRDVDKGTSDECHQVHFISLALFVCAW